MVDCTVLLYPVVVGVILLFVFQLDVAHADIRVAIRGQRHICISDSDVIVDATALVGQEYVNADKYLHDITRVKWHWENKRQNVHTRKKQIKKTIER